jgi:hypothetical protein
MSSRTYKVNSFSISFEVNMLLLLILKKSSLQYDDEGSISTSITHLGDEGRLEMTFTNTGLPVHLEAVFQI